MSLIDSVGYLASALVLLTFCISTKLSLRAVAICSNIAFIAYGLSEEIYPVLILHVILLPVNAFLLFRMASLLRQARGSNRSFAGLAAAVHALEARQGGRDDLQERRPR
jgi:CRP/FNR family cyclic AMP-dependent transcriptional regulator